MNSRKEKALEESKAGSEKHIEKGIPELSAWQSQAVTAGGAWQSATKLAPFRVSGSTTDDLLIIDGEGHKLHLLGDTTKDDVKLKAELRDGRNPSLQPRKQAEFELQTAPVAVLPMRLNTDGLSDLVILKEDSSAPTVALTAQHDEIVDNPDASAARKTTGSWSSEVASSHKLDARAKSNLQDDTLLPLAAGCDVSTPIQVGQTINGQLNTTTSCRLSDGSYADIYNFNGVTGQQIAINMGFVA